MSDQQFKPKEKNIQKITVKIRGLTPLLMNRLNPESLKAKSRMKTQDYSTADDAKKSAYVTDDGQLYIPQECVYSMMINTAKQYRVKRMAMSSLLAGTMRIEPVQILLGRKAIAIDPAKEPVRAQTEGYVIDERAVVIQNQRILKGRAKLLKWEVTFQFVYDANRLPAGLEPTLYEMLEDAGTRMGLLDYRPQHKGWFGTFEIVSFVPEKAVAAAILKVEKAPEPFEEGTMTSNTTEENTTAPTETRGRKKQKS